MRKLLLVLVLVMTACVSRPDPEPAVMRESAPPWDAPRDSISYIDAAGMEHRPLNEDTNPWIVDVEVEVQGEDVVIPPFIGVDRLRAIQAVIHTHDEDGVVWLEGPDTDASTLGEFFTLWGVHFDGECLASYCDVEVVADGETVTDPVDLKLRGHKVIEIRAN